MQDPTVHVFAQLTLLTIKPMPLLPQITVQNVSDFSFSGSDALRVVAQLGSSRQCSRVFCPKKSTAIGSTLLLPVEKVIHCVSVCVDLR